MEKINKSVTKSLRLKETLVNDIYEIAKKERRNFNNMVEVILEDKVKAEKQKL